MLLNPLRHDYITVPGTPFLQDPRLERFLGAQILLSPHRNWAIQTFLKPSKRRAIGGIRARLQDDQGFSTFINQRDLEVLLGLGVPGRSCPWLRRPYPQPGEEGWIGACADDEDLWDDLYERELMIRGDEMLPVGMTIERKIHLESNADAVETWLLLRDWDDFGVCPDPHYTTLRTRWTRVERVRVLWEDYV